MPETPSYTVERFGEEHEPVVVIDTFTGRIDMLAELGRAGTYSPVPGYPGERSLISPRYFGDRISFLRGIMEECFGFAGGARTESCAFSIVATPPEALSNAQRIPHYDSSEDTLLALLHFTQGPDTGGTAFYRHRRSGFETILPERVARYTEAVAQDDAEFGTPPARYLYGDCDRYEMIGEIAAKPDRALLYRGRQLHSGVIPHPPDPATAHISGRLTINTFLHGKV